MSPNAFSTPCMSSALPPLALIIEVISSTFFAFISPNLTCFVASSKSTPPDNNVSFNFAINSRRPLLPSLLNIFFAYGNMASMCLSKLRDI